MAEKTELSEREILPLANCWLRAEVMHGHVHEVRKLYRYKLERVMKDGAWAQFETYVAFWLSALFVVVEGFNKLKIKEPRVQKLFKEHLNNLKWLRHETYHFVLDWPNWS
jgi:hypothetical protein